MTATYLSQIRPSYVDLRTIYLGTDAIKDPSFKPGKTTVLLPTAEDFSAEGTLNTKGFLSGMARLYRVLALKDGDTISFSFAADGNIIVLSPLPTPSVGPAANAAVQEPTTVFSRKSLRHIHLEPFRPSSLNNWEPENETDVYLAFGVLQEFTDYEYCCAASSALLRKLGAEYDESSKPDAILIDRLTGAYLMAEWKKNSADFKVNHKPEDVDVLICWHDNETEASTLPPHVLALHTVAKKAAQQQLLEE
jgi:hypothetical protein